MAIVLAGQMVFLDSGDAPRSAAEVTPLRLKGFSLSPPPNDQCLQKLDAEHNTAHTEDLS